MGDEISGLWEISPMRASTWNRTYGVVSNKNSRLQKKLQCSKNKTFVFFWRLTLCFFKSSSFVFQKGCVLFDALFLFQSELQIVCLHEESADWSSQFFLFVFGDAPSADIINHLHYSFSVLGEVGNECQGEADCVWTGAGALGSNTVSSILSEGIIMTEKYN